LVVDVLLSVVVLLAAAAPVGIAGAWFARRGPGVVAAAFTPGTVGNPGWPHGVQEENDVAWSWDPPDRVAATTIEPLDPANASFEVAAVEPHVAAGPTRRRTQPRAD
ncbi:MAG TPA: hypothetical protein VGC90_11365, partial [Candidatus Limnocylindrales bacterium]